MAERLGIQLEREAFGQNAWLLGVEWIKYGMNMA